MGQILILLLAFLVGLSALRRPFHGISGYYLLSILGPQYIWWWIFGSQRFSLIIASFTMVGISIQMLKKTYNLRVLFEKQNLWVLLLYLCVLSSYFFGAYVDAAGDLGRPAKVLSLYNVIFLFYFCSVLELDLRKLKYLRAVLIVSVVYLVYWANVQYFSQNWYQFDMGRLTGPRSITGGSIYADENVFSMIFVAGIPFVYYLGLEMKRVWFRFLLWSVIPLGMHAIFLTGSRGGLLGLGVSFVFISVIAKKKLVACLLLFFALSFYQMQAGDVMKERSETISQFEGESSAESRLTIWKAAAAMISDHPFAGVGAGSFITAVPGYVDAKPIVAHNTILHFAAESGVMAGVAYLMIIINFYCNFYKVYVQGRKEPTPEVENFNNASAASFTGLIVCSMFLSLNTYEVFFLLLVFNNVLSRGTQGGEHMGQSTLTFRGQI